MKTEKKKLFCRFFIICTVTLVVAMSFSGDYQTVRPAYLNMEENHYDFPDEKTDMEILPTNPANITEDNASLTSPVTHQMDYCQLYSDLNCVPPQKSIVQENTVYLTFDDGPSQQTPKILDILKKNGVKATFFVVGKTDETSRKLMKQIVDEGHTIGLHSYSHEYIKVYQSVDAFLEDYDELNELVTGATGVRPTIFRFPGGSINDYDRDVYPAIIKEMTRRGYTYFDWNVSSEDTCSRPTSSSVYHNIVGHAEQRSRSIILMHDSASKIAVVNALDGVIRELKAKGYSFGTLSNEIKPIVF